MGHEGAGKDLEEEDRDQEEDPRRLVLQPPLQGQVDHHHGKSYEGEPLPGVRHRHVLEGHGAEEEVEKMGPGDGDGEGRCPALRPIPGLQEDHDIGQHRQKVSERKEDVEKLQCRLHGLWFP